MFQSNDTHAIARLSSLAQIVHRAFEKTNDLRFDTQGESWSSTSRFHQGKSDQFLNGSVGRITVVVDPSCIIL